MLLSRAFAKKTPPDLISALYRAIINTTTKQSKTIIRPFSSVGQSGRLITGWSRVRIPEGPPIKMSASPSGLALILSFKRVADRPVNFFLCPA